MTSKQCGEFIALLRKEKNLTQKQLADELKVSDKAVSVLDCLRDELRKQNVTVKTARVKEMIRQFPVGRRGRGIPMLHLLWL